jgi:hypothetical protein
VEIIMRENLLNGNILLAGYRFAVHRCMYVLQSPVHSTHIHNNNRPRKIHVNQFHPGEDWYGVDSNERKRKCGILTPRAAKLMPNRARVLTPNALEIVDQPH